MHDDVDDVDDLGKYCLVGQTPGEPKFSFRLWGNLLHHVSNNPRHWWSPNDDTDSGGKQCIQKIFKKVYWIDHGMSISYAFAVVVITIGVNIAIVIITIGVTVVVIIIITVLLIKVLMGCTGL